MVENSSNLVTLATEFFCAHSFRLSILILRHSYFTSVLFYVSFCGEARITENKIVEWHFVEIEKKTKSPISKLSYWIQSSLS
jgi:hypothetical protein